MNRWIVPALAVLCLSRFASAAELPPTYPVAGYGVISADFNGDGVPDLATSDYFTVSVLLGNGDGTFRSAVNSPASNGDASVLAVGDFDQDGRLDLVTSYVILLGNGDGSFAAPSYLSTRYPRGLAVGDLNGDGKADLVGVDDGEYGCGWDGPCSGAVTVQLGNGDGTFASPTSYLDALCVTGTVSLADFDGDGDLDVVSLAGLQLGNGDGTLASPNLLPASGPGAVADFNADGHPDVATVQYSPAYIVLGNGDGTFRIGDFVSNADGFGAMALGDFNGDAAPDLALVESNRRVKVWFGRGDGTLGPAIELPDFGFPVWSMTAADFDGDGLLDLAVNGIDSSSYVVSIVLNEGNWPAANGPSVSISDATVAEGNSGTKAVTFTVSLSAACTKAVTVDYATADDSATASGDYQAASGTLTIGVGNSSGTISVMVTGDRLGEPTERFFVNLGHVTNAFLSDPQAVATIVDDEPTLRISPSVAKAEGKQRETTPFPFVVTLSKPYDAPVSVSFRTVAGTANGSDFDAKSGTLTFNAAETSKTITIDVKGDSKREPDETFSVELYAPSGNASLTDRYGRGTILNDD